MVVRDVMQASLVTIGPDAPLTEAIGLLLKHHISGLPVVDTAGRAVGVLTEKDLLRIHSAHPPPNRVSELMTHDPLTLPVDAPLERAFDVLMSRPFRRLLVEEQGKLVGIVSRADLMPAVLDALHDLADA